MPLRLELVPMLREQRKLYDLPRGPGRFQTYLAQMRGPSVDDIEFPPYVAMNPMAKLAAPAAYDALIRMDAEDVARAALEEAERRLRRVQAQFRVGLAVADDAEGGWTHRCMTEGRALLTEDAAAKRGWIVPTFWSSEEAREDRVRWTVLEAVYRTLHRARWGVPRTLAHVLDQEGRAQCFARGPIEGAAREAVKRSRDALRPHSASSSYATHYAALYGDEEAKVAGYPPLGVPHRAGFALAWAIASENGPPEEFV